VITLTVISFNGAPSGEAPSASFDELGGTIGRADTNQLVLPDPERSISRVHAQVVYRSGRYAIVDRGSNPIAVNGRALGSGAEQLLGEGDQVQIGGYVLRAALAPAGAPAASSTDPFADLLGPASGGKPRAGAPAANWDPLAPSYKPDPVPGTSPGAYLRSAPPPPAAAAPAHGGIPDDWNPFAPDAPKPAAPGGARPRDPLDLGLDIGAAAPAPLIPGMGGGAGSSGDSLDALFGLKPGNAGGDPLGGSLLGEAAAQPNMAGHADPLRALQAAPQATSQTAPDDFLDLHRPFQLPAAPSIPPAAPFAAPAVPPAVGGAVMSWDAQAEGRTVIRPGGARAPEPAAAPPSQTVLAAMSPAAPAAAAPVDIAFATAGPFVAPAAAPAGPVAPPSASRAAAAQPAEVAALLAALREGLATPEVAVDALTPELMKLLGQIVREAAAGTVDLLVARAALKREVRAEATMIVARENNPLKFSPSAEAALQHLLAPPLRGFMPAAPAMRDAYNDLRAHQFGFIAGMKAALAGVLDRFDPAQLESRLTRTSGIKSLLPGSRKAAMWDVFIEHYALISQEAEDDFHSLFGKAFLRAYEEHIEQLEKGQH